MLGRGKLAINSLLKSEGEGSPPEILHCWPGKKKQDFSPPPPLQPISLTTKQSWSKTLIGGGGWSETVTTNLPPK